MESLWNHRRPSWKSSRTQHGNRFSVRLRRLAIELLENRQLLSTGPLRLDADTTAPESVGGFAHNPSVMANMAAWPDDNATLQPTNERLGLSPAATAHTSLLTRSYDVGPSLISPEWFASLVEPGSRGEAEATEVLWEGQSIEVCRDEWIVQLTRKALQNVASVADTVQFFQSDGLQIEVLRGLGMAGQLLIRAPGAEIGDLMDWMGNNPNVAYCEPNALRTIEMTPNDPRFVNGDQWNMHKIDAPEAWEIYTGSDQVV